MSLKCRTETVHIVEVNDLEAFIKEQTGHSYECVPNEEWDNDQLHRFVIDGKLNEHYSKYWEAFKSTGEEHMFMTRYIMDGLCAAGKLPAGIYLINVSW